MLGALKMLKKACLETPVLAFANFIKLFLLETDVSKLGPGIVPSQKETDGQYHPIAYMSHSLTVHECNYHLTKQEFLSLKWVIMEQFQVYLLWKPFIVGTNNNLLTYIRTIPNLDATQHCWVELLAGFTFNIEYQKDGTMQPQMPWAKLHQSWMQELWSPSWTDSLCDWQEEQMLMTLWWWKLMKRYISMSRKLPSKLQPLICMWAYMWLIGLAAQWEDPVFKAAIDWIPNQKVQNLKHLLGNNVNTEEGMVILWEWKRLVLYQGALYHCHTPAGKLKKFCSS